MVDDLNLILDIGHGGKNQGAIGNGINENEYNLCFGRAFKRYLNACASPFNVYLTRERDDQTVSFPQRGAMAKLYGADIVLSIHVNAGGPTQHGGQFFYRKGCVESREIADVFAQCWPFPSEVFSVKDYYAPEEDHWLERPDTVLDPYDDLGCPAILCELGFLSHPGDAHELGFISVKNWMMAALHCGLQSFLRSRLR